jgi:amphi-Trp domain-containing protein
MTALGHSGEDRVSRRQAAERLIDLAHALAAGAAIELDEHGRRVTVPVPDVVVLESESESTDERVRLEMRLSWTTPDRQCRPGRGAGRHAPSVTQR